MIKGLWNRILNDKILFAIFVAVCVVVVLDVAVLIFDIVEFVTISNNRASLSSLFVPLNVAIIVANLVVAAAGVCYAIFRKK